MPTPRKDFAVAFWAKVKRTDGCWNWLGARRSNGYGNYRESGSDGKTLLAHRVAWQLTHGAPPDALKVLHRCDNRLCVNPEHLFIGTAAINTADMIAKGRARPPHHKLDEATVRLIRAAVSTGLSMNKTGRRYGVSTELVSRIVRREVWKHVD